MDHADRRIALEQRLVGRRDRLLAALDVIEGRAHLRHQAATERFGRAVEGGRASH